MESELLVHRGQAAQPPISLRCNESRSSETTKISQNSTESGTALLSKGALSDSGSSDHSDDEDESYYLPDNCLQSASVLQSKGEGDHIPGGKSHPGVEHVEESKKVSIPNPNILDEGETGAQAPMEIPSSKDDEGENLQDLHSTPHYNHQSKKNSII